MEKKEKVEFILEQMRLCLAKKDYIRTSIISKKINTRFFSTGDDVDVSYYNVFKVIRIHLNIFALAVSQVMFTQFVGSEAKILPTNDRVTWTGGRIPGNV